ncbi:probable class I alpha mannosidase [Rhynchosporium secalis]|uniref:alpha-1,2-Mannosidase n=1 Tax=Rhynchosporium secalis TaxID=38038 RepID=A0A1E1MPZ1_RHYSE|nr:probable class I alpha mannosidase [Rhynchosporium secalis]
MPAIRRWRAFALAIVFAMVSLYYLTHERNVWNYGYTPYIPAPKSSSTKNSNIHFKKLPDRHPIKSLMRLPTGSPVKIPQIQASAPVEDAKAKEVRLQRRAAVKESFVHSWTGYKKHAWLRDEVAPLSGAYKDTFGGWAATLVDSLDTLWIMGMKEDFEVAVKAVKEIDFSTTETESINVFETTIRYLGGFLAAYDISGGKYKVLLSKAVEVGELLVGCFDTENRMPISRWDWKSYTQGASQQAPNSMLVSEIGSLTLEFTRLSQLTGDLKYYDAVQRISNEFEKSQNRTKLPGLWPVSINAEKLLFDEDNTFTLGGMSDSLYEYFPKQYLILGGLLSQPKTLYENFIDVAKKQMFFRAYNPKNEKLTFSGDVRMHDSEATLTPRSQHLSCFTGGMVGLAAKIFSRPDDLSIAEELTHGCMWAYDSSINGIMPELFNVLPCAPGSNSPCKWNESIYHEALNKNSPPPSTSHGPPSEAELLLNAQTIIKEKRLTLGFTQIDDRRYILRPEAIESVFLLYRMTGKKEYEDAAWRMFLAVEKISRTKIAAAAIGDVTIPFKGTGKGGEGEVEKGEKMDSMESFWLAETLKYFYLCFEEWDVVSLDTWVLNTEAHPLKRPS